MKWADEFIEIARVVKLIGLKGELKVIPLTRIPRDLERYRTFHIARKDGEFTAFQVEQIRTRPGFAGIRLAGLDSIERAETFIGQTLWIHRSQLQEPEEGEYYIRDLIGLQVVSTGGETLGTLTDVIELPAHDVYEVSADGTELLIPAVSDIVLNVDMKQRRMTVRLLDGLGDLA